mmetsp:Transcript_4761/g.6255  ORF Transcript_4761/g.6255 Transcript_4761/m.6255 type:complete len:183 (-) Transcript_4761:138-686(-)|eukprot:CAMPEP_0195250298 /NCGR_PEP_ID=MMETSP0706-20130129/2615_1 /TAXON_ID=33640 /ORGANISM="Asterionellopsis glacialis, Strain CCMP134" /LENGTH=182 /DNA_ID=CAMNT_0040302239 /DNA_START=10 /DNA_END=561 /DNA_ORIENTATION=-
MTGKNIDECHAAVPLLEDPTMFLLESGAAFAKESFEEQENEVTASQYGVYIAAILGFDLGYVAPWLIVCGQTYFALSKNGYEQNYFEVFSIFWVFVVAFGVLCLNIVAVKAMSSRLETKNEPEKTEAKLEFWFSAGALTGIVVACGMVVWRMEMEMDNISLMIIIAVYTLSIASKYTLYRMA